MPILLGLLSYWKVALAVVVVVALAGGAWGIRSYMAEHELMKKDIARKDDVIRENVQALATMTQQHAITVRVLEDERAVAERRSVELNQIRREIANAPDSDDGPVAPVLSRALERLRPEAPAADQD